MCAENIYDWQYLSLVFTKLVNSTFRTFWLAPVTRNILGYSLFCDRSQDGVSLRDIFGTRNLSDKWSSRTNKYQLTNYLLSDVFNLQKVPFVIFLQLSWYNNYSPHDRWTALDIYLDALCLGISTHHCSPSPHPPSWDSCILSSGHVTFHVAENEWRDLANLCQIC